VTGTVSINGSPELAKRVDVTPKAALEMSNLRYDAASHEVVFDIRLSNLSHDTVRGPVALRLVDLRTVFRNAWPVNADNGQQSRGAVWDMSSTIHGSTLLPGASSTSRKLRFRTSGEKRTLPGRGSADPWFRISLKILATGTSP
jgi:hypothetical protein